MRDTEPNYLFNQQYAGAHNFLVLVVAAKSAKMRFCRVPLCRVSPLFSRAFSPFLPISLSPPLPCHSLTSITTVVSASQAQHLSTSKLNETRWKPMCLYYTQGKCTMVMLFNQFFKHPFVYWAVQRCLGCRFGC